MLMFQNSKNVNGVYRECVHVKEFFSLFCRPKQNNILAFHKYIYNITNTHVYISNLTVSPTTNTFENTKFKLTEQKRIREKSLAKSVSVINSEVNKMLRKI